MVSQLRSFSMDKGEALQFLSQLLGHADEFKIFVEGKKEPCKVSHPDPQILYAFRHICDQCNGVLLLTLDWVPILDAKNRFDDFNNRHPNKRRDYSIHHLKTLDEITAFLASAGFPAAPVAGSNTEMPQG